MKLMSLIRDGQKLIPAEVEVYLIPGLPTIQVLGLPDQIIKESLVRVRSALRAQGFQWPRARQVLVNIRPVNLKKSSRGLELAIAAGIIWQTRQRPPPMLQSRYFVYGELTLEGDVLEPDDLRTDFFGDEDDLVLTGAGEGRERFRRERIHSLAEIDSPRKEDLVPEEFTPVRPEFGLRRSFTAEEAQWLSVVALGEFHALLAGAHGMGKTTLAKSVASFLRPPTVDEFRAQQTLDSWRPWIAPHHSSSAISLVGGGSPPRRGEISRADGGVLFLDELLEFPQAAQDALREPVESGTLRLGRGAHVAVFPARIQLIGTTNLCPCGRWVPGREITCGRARARCRSMVDRISGPFLDRFDMLHLHSAGKRERTLEGREILETLEQARQFQERWGREPTLEILTRRLKPTLREVWSQEIDFLSERRKRATLEVAAALADLSQNEVIGSSHFEQAMAWTFRNFEALRGSVVLPRKLFDTHRRGG